MTLTLNGHNRLYRRISGSALQIEYAAHMPGGVKAFPSRRLMAGKCLVG
jgi:hypothetical protein